MKTINDLEKMSSLELFLHNGTLKGKDKDLESQLEYWHEKCCTAFNTCMEKLTKKNYEKLELAMNTYKSVLDEKVENKSELELLQKVARRKGVNLKKHILTYDELIG